MNLLYKLITNNKFLRYSPFSYWFRLMNHQDYRFDDRHLYADFWHSLNAEWEHMEYVYKFEEFWGKNAKPETIVLSQKDFDVLLDKLNEPPKYDEKIARVLSKKSPWDD